MARSDHGSLTADAASSAITVDAPFAKEVYIFSYGAAPIYGLASAKAADVSAPTKQGAGTFVVPAGGSWVEPAPNGSLSVRLITGATQDYSVVGA